jgi:Mn-containing catalase
MLNKGVKGAIAEGLTEQGELYRMLNQGGDSHVTSLLYGGGAALTNSGGVPWTAAYIDTIGEPTADLRSNIAAEARAKIIYERLMNVTEDPGVRDALGFLMTREIAHQKSFEKALYSIQPNFPPGKVPGKAQFTDKYFNTSRQVGDERGPWNEDRSGTVTTAEGMMPVDGGDEQASVRMAGRNRRWTNRPRRFEIGTEGDPPRAPISVRTGPAPPLGKYACDGRKRRSAPLPGPRLAFGTGSARIDAAR